MRESVYERERERERKRDREREIERERERERKAEKERASKRESGFEEVNRGRPSGVVPGRGRRVPFSTGVTRN